MNQSLLRPGSRQQRVDGRQLMKPLIRAFALGYLSSTTPRLISFLRRAWVEDGNWREKARRLLRLLIYPFRVDSLATACAALIGGSTLLPHLWYRLQGDRKHGLVREPSVRLVRFCAALLSSWFSFQLLNARPVRVRASDRSNVQQSAANSANSSRPAAAKSDEYRPDLAGRTLDLTLFTATRAADVIACLIWTRWRSYRKAAGKWTSVETVIPQLADAGVFAFSAAVVMWAWFYLPERLPRSYEKWIGEAARVDMRLVEALRRCRRGTFVYGKNTGQASLLQPMCEDYGWPLIWGDPAKTIPIPCEMVHMGCGPSCERHAVSRFVRTFKWACATYIPLQLAFRLRRATSAATLARAIKDAMRSSAFLAGFVAIFYYSVCLARTRLGPKIFDRKVVTPQMWDAGLCVGAGCMMCGWSVLLESPHKRSELSLFVAPRAAATICPRFYDKRYLHRERAVFAISTAILLTCLQERPTLMRGVFGKIGARVLGS